MIDAVTVVQVVALVCTKSNLFNLTKLIEKYINISIMLNNHVVNIYYMAYLMNLIQ